MNKKEILKKIKEILSGIDKDEVDSDNGWWETSEGSKFGASKLKQIEELFENES